MQSPPNPEGILRVKCASLNLAVRRINDQTLLGGSNV